MWRVMWLMWRNLLLLALCCPTAAAAGLAIADDVGHVLHLKASACRIISLSPHTTELLYAAGAGPCIIGVSKHSDYPPAARQIAPVGRVDAADIETILTLRPDLIVAWHDGNSASQLQRLRALGIPVFESQPTSYAMIASSLERLGALSGAPAAGHQAALDFRARWQALEQRYRSRAPVDVFYQIWSQPLMTLNAQHLASAVLRTCGGRNIFADLPQLVPSVGIESVIAADPEVILVPDDSSEQPLERWRQFGKLKAVARGNLLTIHADWLNRPGPRILDATEQVCTLLESARAKRGRH